MIIVHYETPNNCDVLIFNDDIDKKFKNLLLLTCQIYHKKEMNYDMVTSSLLYTMQQSLTIWSVHKTQFKSVEKLKNDLIKNITNLNFDIKDALNKHPIVMTISNVVLKKIPEQLQFLIL